MDKLVTKQLFTHRRELIHSCFRQEKSSTDHCIFLGSAEDHNIKDK